MSDIKQLKTEELEAVKKIRQEYIEISAGIGDIELQLNNLSKEKQRLLESYNDLIRRESELAAKLTATYGNGSINIETGVVS